MPNPPRESAVRWTSASVLAAIATRAPSAASAWAMPSPMPRVLAVTSATLPAIPRSTSGILMRCCRLEPSTKGHRSLRARRRPCCWCAAAIRGSSCWYTVPVGLISRRARTCFRAERCTPTTWAGATRSAWRRCARCSKRSESCWRAAAAGSSARPKATGCVRSWKAARALARHCASFASSRRWTAWSCSRAGSRPCSCAGATTRDSSWPNFPRARTCAPRRAR